MLFTQFSLIISNIYPFPCQISVTLAIVDYFKGHTEYFAFCMLIFGLFCLRYLCQIPCIQASLVPKVRF